MRMTNQLPPKIREAIETKAEEHGCEYFKRNDLPGPSSTHDQIFHAGAEALWQHLLEMEKMDKFDEDKIRKKGMELHGDSAFIYVDGALDQRIQSAAQIAALKIALDSCQRSLAIHREASEKLLSERKAEIDALKKEVANFKQGRQWRDDEVQKIIQERNERWAEIVALEKTKTKETKE